MRLFIQRIVLLSQVIASTSIMILGIIVCYEIILRYVLSHPTMWVGEISSQLLLWLSLMAVIVSLDKEKHIRVDLVFVYFPHRIKTILNIFTSILMLAFCGLLFWEGSNYFLEAYRGNWKHYGNLYIPMVYTRIGIPVVGLFICFQIILKIYDYVSSLKQKDL